MGIFGKASALSFKQYKAAGKPKFKGWVNALADFLNLRFTSEDTLSITNIKFVDGDNEIRFRFENNVLYLDIKLTDLAWDGTEDTDWENLTSFTIPE